MKIKFLCLVFIFGQVCIANAQNQTSNTLNSNNDILQRLEFLEGKLLDLEYEQAIHKLNFSGAFLNHYEYYHSKRERDRSVDVPYDEDVQDANLSVFLMRVDLNFDVRVSKNFRFFSTIGMSKYWNMDERNTRIDDESENFSSIGGGYRTTGSGAQFDTAYLSYKNVNSPWSFAIGRMTTNNGPPLNQIDGIKRSGTYPLMTYNVVLDGAAIVYNFKNYLPANQTLKMRLLYTPFMSVDTDDKSHNRSDTVANTAPGPVNDRGERVDSNANFATILTEYENHNFSWLKSLDLYHAYFSIDKTYYPRRQNPTDDDIEYEGSNASIFYLGFREIGGAGLNASVTYSSYFLRSDLAAGDSTENYFFNLNYRFDNRFNRGHIIGAEYVNNDEYRLPTDYTTLQVAPFYNIANGEGYHLFYTVPFEKSHIIRFGLYKMREKGSSFLLSNVSEDQSSLYARWKVFF